MSIDFDKFLVWAESRFDDVRVSGEEIKINSIFREDRKHKLWCNPTGGKTESQNGVYHCWKTDKKGSLVGLVMLVDNCSFEDALERLDASSGRLDDLERRVQEIFDKKEPDRPPATETKGLDMPPSCYLFDDLPSSNRLKREAEEYLESRKIKKEGLFVCTSGRYRNRIVIPYYDKSGSLIYYNGRYVGEQESSLRYLGPPKDLGIGKGDVLYAQTWPSPNEKIYITEGEFDAMSLFQCGFKSAALGGKVLSGAQTEMIRGCIPVLCLDADGAGGEAMPKIAQRLFSMGFPKVFYVRPCKEFKDWNKLLEKKGEKILKHYVMSQERQYDNSVGGGDWESTKIAMNNMVG